MHGVSTRSVDDLVKALGGDSGISKPEVSRICQALDEPLTAFRIRPLDHVRFPYVCLDATCCKAQVNHQIVSRAAVAATGITEDGNREVLGLMAGDSESEAFWKEFLRSLRERGLSGVRPGRHRSALRPGRRGPQGYARRRLAAVQGLFSAERLRRDRPGFR